MSPSPDVARAAAPSARPTALVTGGTSGIGLEFARQLAGRGHDLVLVARDADRLAAVAAELTDGHGVRVETLAADLIDREQLERVERRVGDRDRPIDLLVNNAGFGLKERFLDNPVEREQAHLDILVVAPMRLTHAALTAMVARCRGRIVNVSSVAGFLPRGTYSAAKAYVNSFTEWAHHEYADRGVVVMALCPGFTRTEFHQRMDVGRDSAPKPLWLDVHEVVATALRDLDRERVFSIPGLQYRAIVTLTRAVPNGLLQRLQSLGRR